MMVLTSGKILSHGQLEHCAKFNDAKSGIELSATETAGIRVYRGATLLLETQYSDLSDLMRAVAFINHLEDK